MLSLYWPAIPYGKEAWGFLSGSVFSAILFTYSSVISWGKTIVDIFVTSSTFPDRKLANTIVTSIFFCIGIYGGMQAYHLAVRWKWIWTYGAIVLFLMYLRGIEIVYFFVFIGVLTCIAAIAVWIYKKTSRSISYRRQRYRIGWSVMAALCCVAGVALISLEAGYWNPPDLSTDSKGIQTILTLPSGSSTSNQEIESYIIQYTNEERQNYGIIALIPHSCLTNIARAHSEDMADNHFFSHVNLRGQDPTQRGSVKGCPTSKPMGGGVTKIGIGENIGKMATGNVIGIGYVADNSQSIARAQVNSWMNSPGHRQNILDPSYSHIGVGTAKDSSGYYISTQDFW
jgi:uncharacterized protein YkwD